MILTLCITSVTAFLCAAVRWYLDRPERKEASLLSGWISLTALRNHRGAFDLPIHRSVLLGSSVLALGTAWVHRYLSPLGAGLVLGGGISNLWERLHVHSVYDYLRFPKSPGKLKRYVYNLADFAIFFGLLAMVLRIGKKKR